MRLACCVPFCRRTRKNEKGYTEWVCAVHWRAVPPHVKHRKNKLFRRYRHLFGDTPSWKYPPGSPQRLAAVRLGRMCDRSWNLAKRAAIERAVGIL